MKLAYVILLLLAGTASAQSLRYEIIDDLDFVYLINNVDVIGQIQTQELSVRVLTFPNLPGSAGLDSGETTHNLYVAVSEYEELPEQRLFLFRDLYAPKLERTENQAEIPILFVSYGGAAERRLLRITASIAKLGIEKVGPQ